MDLSSTNNIGNAGRCMNLCMSAHTHTSTHTQNVIELILDLIIRMLNQQRRAYLNRLIKLPSPVEAHRQIHRIHFRYYRFS